MCPFWLPNSPTCPKPAFRTQGLGSGRSSSGLNQKGGRGQGGDMHSFIQCTFIRLMLIKHPLCPTCWARPWPYHNEQKWMLLPAFGAHRSGIASGTYDRATWAWQQLLGSEGGIMAQGRGPILFQVGGAQATADSEECQLRGSASLANQPESLNTCLFPLTPSTSSSCLFYFLKILNTKNILYWGTAD